MYIVTQSPGCTTQWTLTGLEHSSGYLGVDMDLLSEPVEVGCHLGPGHVEGGLSFILKNFWCPFSNKHFSLQIISGQLIIIIGILLHYFDTI